VIAYGAGGALETIVPGETGLFFAEQTPDALGEALGRFHAEDFSAEVCRANALRFSKERFQAGYREAVERVLGSA